MNAAARLGAFAVGLAVVFAGAIGAGRLAGPVDAETESAHTAGGHTGGEHRESVEMPGGLEISQNGYTLVPETTIVRPGRRTDFRFALRGPDGRPVTRYTPTHEKKLHFIVVRRDLSGFQHLHPVEVGGGTWSVPLTLAKAGDYRAFADFAPDGRKPLTLGMELRAPGDYRPAQVPAPSRTTAVDGYEVTLSGDLTAGRASRVTLSVHRDGRPVTDLQPYLGAYGHLVALRDGDLAYLHVHPDGEPRDGRTRPGPDITFHAEVPSAGSYRLYLDFQHRGTVRTAEFTVHAGDTAAPVTPEPAESSPSHKH